LILLAYLNQYAQLFNRFGRQTQDYFIQRANSNSARNHLKNYKSLLSRYKVGDVPTIIVNGKYKVTMQNLRGYKEMIDVLDFLVKLERR
jgi:thiol:disulfide interchange protein DsbA